MIQEKEKVKVISFVQKLEILLLKYKIQAFKKIVMGGFVDKNQQQKKEQFLEQEPQIMTEINPEIMPEIKPEIKPEVIIQQNIQPKQKFDIRVIIVRNNIVEEKCDAIVNAANKQLWEGGGVCGFIFQACGSQQLHQKCREILKIENRQQIKTGQAVITEICKLAEKGGAKWIIHAPGPVWKRNKQGDQFDYDKCKNKLRLTVKNSLELAFMKNNFNVISIPAISSGVYGFPKDVCAKIFNEAIQQFKLDIENQPNPREIIIRLCNFDHETTQVFEKEFNQLREFLY